MLYADFPPSRHTVQKIYRSYTISERAGNLFVNTYTAYIEELLDKKYGLNKRDRSIYAKSVLNAALLSIRYGRWSPELIERHIKDQILIRKLIEGKSYQDLRTKYFQIGLSHLKKLYPGETSDFYKDVVQDAWEAFETAILKKGFVLKSTIIHFFFTIIRNTYHNKKRKYILLKQFQKTARENISGNNESNSSSGFLRDQEAGFDEYNTLDQFYDRLDAIVLKEINLLNSETCKDFLKLRYGISDELFGAAKGLEYYTNDELRDIFESAYSEGFKGKTIKEVAEKLGIERKRQNIVAQRCLDRLVIRVYPAIEKIMQSNLYQGLDINDLFARIENREKIAAERQKKRYDDNKKYKNR